MTTTSPPPQRVRRQAARGLDPALLRALAEQLAVPCPSCGAKPYATAGPAVATTHDRRCPQLEELDPQRLRGTATELHPTPDASAPGLQARVIVPHLRPRHRLVLVEDPARGTVPVYWRLDRGRRWRCSVHGSATRPDACAHIAAAARALGPVLLGLQQPQRTRHG